MASSKRLYLYAVEKIQEMIVSGQSAPGSRLPPERTLADTFGVSRPTIREAIIALEAKGLVYVKTGSGVYVCENRPASNGLCDNVSPFEVVEARVLIEGEAAALAAAMISDEQIIALQEALEQMKKEDASSTEADRMFHSIISDATQNRAFSSIIQGLWDAQEGLDHIRQAHQAVCMQNREVRLSEHEAICTALSNRDPQAARLAMRQHFSRMLNALHETNEQRQEQELRRKVSETRERFSFDRLVDKTY